MSEARTDTTQARPQEAAAQAAHAGRMTVAHRDQYTVGWTDGSIHEFVSSMGEPPASMAYALVTCLDSSRDLPAMRETSRPLPLDRHVTKWVCRKTPMAPATLCS